MFWNALPALALWTVAWSARYCLPSVKPHSLLLAEFHSWPGQSRRLRVVEFVLVRLLTLVWYCLYLCMVLWHFSQGWESLACGSGVYKAKACSRPHHSSSAVKMLVIGCTRFACSTWKPYKRLPVLSEVQTVFEKQPVGWSLDS